MTETSPSRARKLKAILDAKIAARDAQGELSEMSTAATQTETKPSRKEPIPAQEHSMALDSLFVNAPGSSVTVQAAYDAYTASPIATSGLSIAEFVKEFERQTGHTPQSVAGRLRYLDIAPTDSEDPTSLRAGVSARAAQSTAPVTAPPTSRTIPPSQHPPATPPQDNPLETPIPTSPHLEETESQKVLNTLAAKGIDSPEKFAAQIKQFADALKTQPHDIRAALQGTVFEELSETIQGDPLVGAVEAMLAEAARHGEAPENIPEFRRTGKFGDAILRRPLIAKGGEVFTSLTNVGPMTSAVVGMSLAAGWTTIGPQATSAIVASILAADIMTKSGVRGSIVKEGNVGKGLVSYVKTQPVRATLFTLASILAVYGPTKALVRASVDTLVNSGSAHTVSESAETLKKPLLEAGRVMEKYIDTFKALEKAIPGIEGGADVSSELSQIAASGINLKAGERTGKAVCGPLCIKKFYTSFGHTNVSEVFSGMTVSGSATPLSMVEMTRAYEKERGALGLKPGEKISEHIQSMWQKYLDATKADRTEALDIITELSDIGAALDKKTFWNNIVDVIINPYLELGQVTTDAVQYAKDIGTYIETGTFPTPNQEKSAYDATRSLIANLDKEYSNDPSLKTLKEMLAVPESTTTREAQKNPISTEQTKTLVGKVRDLFTQLSEQFKDSEVVKTYRHIVDVWAAETLGEDPGKIGITDARTIKTKADRLTALFQNINTAYAQSAGEIDLFTAHVERIYRSVSDKGDTKATAPQFSLPEVTLGGVRMPALALLMSDEEMSMYVEKRGVRAYAEITGALGLSAVLNFLFLLITLQSLAANGRRSKVELEEMLPKMREAERVRTEGMANAINQTLGVFANQTVHGTFALTDPQQIQYLLRTLARQEGQSLGTQQTGYLIDRLNPHTNSLQTFTQAVADTLAIGSVEAAPQVIQVNMVNDMIRSLETTEGRTQLISKIIPGGIACLTERMSESGRQEAVGKALVERAEFLELRIRTAKEIIAHTLTHGSPALHSIDMDFESIASAAQSAVIFDRAAEKELGIISYLQGKIVQDSEDLQAIRSAFVTYLPAYARWSATDASSGKYRGASSKTMQRILIPAAVTATGEQNLTPNAALIQSLYEEAQKSTGEALSGQVVQETIRHVATQHTEHMKGMVAQAFPQFFGPQAATPYAASFSFTAGDTDRQTSFVVTVHDPEGSRVESYQMPFYGVGGLSNPANVEAALDSMLTKHLPAIGQDVVRNELKRHLREAGGLQAQTRDAIIAQGSSVAVATLNTATLDTLLELRETLHSSDIQKQAIQALITRSPLSERDLGLIHSKNLLNIQPKMSRTELSAFITTLQQEGASLESQGIRMRFNFLTDEVVAKSTGIFSRTVHIPVLPNTSVQTVLEKARTLKKPA